MSSDLTFPFALMYRRASSVSDPGEHRPFMLRYLSTNGLRVSLASSLMGLVIPARESLPQQVVSRGGIQEQS